MPPISPADPAPAPAGAARSRRYRMHARRRRAYEVRLVDGVLGDRLPAVARRLHGRTGMLVTTPTVAALYARELRERLREHGVDFPLLVLEGGEADKSMAQVERVCAAAYGHGLGRTSLLLAVGGGVCSDVATVAASLIRRGIATARIPTTLIGQVDAAVGVKGAVNFEGKKSALGCFHPPEWVLVDPALLRTLPAPHVRGGLAEIVKMAIIRDRGLFELLERHGAALAGGDWAGPGGAVGEIVWRAIEGMLDELAPNLYEDAGYQRRVDFGHVFSPLLEARSGYRLSHGEAVAVDMALTVRVAARLGWLPIAERDRALALLHRLGLPTSSPLLSDDLLHAAVRDSAAHRGGHLNLVVPTAIGRCGFLERAADLPADLLRRARDEGAAPAPPRVRVAEPGCVVFDVGGTRLRVGVYRPAAGTLADVRVVATPSRWAAPGAAHGELYAALLSRMVEAGAAVAGGDGPAAVSVAFAGPVDAEGRVLGAPTLWGPGPGAPVELAADLRRAWPGARVRVLNDLSAAGYRYLRHRHDDFCIVTVSSGIGNKVFISGAPFTGACGRGGEIGHARVDFSPAAPRCECGGDGHLGAVSSGRGTLLYARRLRAAQPRAFARSLLASLSADDADDADNGGSLTNERIARAFRADDAWTVELIRRTSAPLGRALALIHAALGIERFTVIGGFAFALGDRFRELLAGHAAASTWRLGQEWGRMIEFGEDDDLCGMIGAGRFSAEIAGRETRFNASGTSR